MITATQNAKPFVRTILGTRRVDRFSRVGVEAVFRAIFPRYDDDAIAMKISGLVGGNTIERDGMLWEYLP